MVLPFISFPFWTFLDVSSWLDGSQVVPNGISIGISKKYTGRNKNTRRPSKKREAFIFLRKKSLLLNSQTGMGWIWIWEVSYVEILDFRIPKLFTQQTFTQHIRLLSASHQPTLAARNSWSRYLVYPISCPRQAWMLLQVPAGNVGGWYWKMQELSGRRAHFTHTRCECNLAHAVSVKCFFFNMFVFHFSKQAFGKPSQGIPYTHFDVDIS